MPIKPFVADLSHHNRITSFVAARKAGLVGVILKATEGSTYVDRTYLDMRKRAEDAGLLVGAYHFATNAPVKQQVEHFLSHIGEHADNVLLALDYEPAARGRTMKIEQAAEWLRLVGKKSGQLPKLYSGHLIKETLPKYDAFFAKHDLWLAQYGAKPVCPKSWDNYWLWQFTGDGMGPKPHEYPGLGKNIDLNTFARTETELRAEWVREA